ncbi:hypothetical protein ACHWQZ_G010193 [Mnemiopsis leidyi]
MLVNHSHGSSSSNKRPRNYGTPHPDAKKRELTPVTKHNPPKQKPRDYEIKPNPTPQTYDGQADDNLKIVDSFDDDGQDDQGLQVVDNYDNDGQSDDGLTVVDSIDSIDYKKLYEECLASKKRIENLCQKKLLDLKKKYEERIDLLKENYRDKLRDFGTEMKAEYDKRVDKIRESHAKATKDLNDAHEKAMEDFERECKRKIKLLSDQLQAVKEDDDDLRVYKKGAPVFPHFCLTSFEIRSNMQVYIGVDGFTLPCGFIVKEICFLYPNWEFCHLLFKPPADQNLSDVDKRTIRYTTMNLNNLNYLDGDVPYNCLNDIIQSVQLYDVYTYSEVAMKFLQEMLPTTMITNIQTQGFEMPSTLPDPKCFRQHNHRYCAKAKAIEVKKFVESGH